MQQTLQAFFRTGNTYRIIGIITFLLFFNIRFSEAQVLINSIAGVGATGIGSGGYGGDNGPSVSGKLNAPTGICGDNAGNIYVADQLNNRVRKIDIAGNITTFAGNGVAGYSGDNGPATSAKLNWPIGVFADKKGNIYITENSGSKVRKVDALGTITTVAGTDAIGYTGDGGLATAAKLHAPSAVGFDDAGNMYISDWLNNVIRKVDTFGIITTIAGTGIAGFSGDGGPAANAQLNQNFGIYVDGPGNIFIADWYNNRIRKIDVNGNINTIAGTGTPGYSGNGGPAMSADLYAPGGIWVDGNGNIYITEQYGGNTVRVIDAQGNISLVAGNGTAGFSGDGGAATSAQLQKPTSIYVDVAGIIYVADQANNRVRKIYNGSSPTLSVSVSGNSFCACSSNDVQYIATGVFNNDNIFTAQLSDVAGGFSFPVSIGSIQSNALTGTISVTIPCNTIPGNKYRLRVVSSSPAFTGTDNGTDLTVLTSIIPSVAISSNPPGKLCPGTNITFTADTLNGTNTTLQWILNGTPVGNGNLIFATNALDSGDVVSCIMTSAAACAIPPADTSNAIIVSEAKAVEAGYIATSKDTICRNTIAILNNQASSGGTVKWQWSETNSAFTDISFSGKVYPTQPLTKSTYFRTYMTNGTCSDSSDAFLIVVIPSPEAIFSTSAIGHTVTFNSDLSKDADFYSWDFNDGKTSDLPNPVHEFDTSGVFHVCLTVKNNSNCNFTLCQNVTVFATGIDNGNAQTWNIYPNPFSDELIITTGSINFNITVYDIQGRIAFQRKYSGNETENNIKLNFTNVASGVYFLKVESHGFCSVQKVVKD